MGAIRSRFFQGQTENPGRCGGEHVAQLHHNLARRASGACALDFPHRLSDWPHSHEILPELPDGYSQGAMAKSRQGNPHYLSLLELRQEGCRKRSGNEEKR